MVRNRTASLIFIFITLLIDVLGMGLVIPVMPKLITVVSKGGLSAGAHWYGLLLASYGLMQFLFAPVLGSLSDRYGRRPVLLAALFFTAVDYTIMARASTVGWLFVGRILTGITGASFTTASAYIADVSPPEKRAQNFGLIGAAFGIGFIVGPAVGGVLGSLSLRAPFWGAAILSLLNTLYGLLALPESLSAENRRAVTFHTANPLGALRIMSRYRWVLWMAGSIAIGSLAMQSLQSTWVLYTSYRFHWTPRDNGMTLALIGLGSIAVQSGLVGFLVRRLGERRTILWGIFFNFVGFLGFAMASQGWIMIVMILVWCLSFAGGPTTQSLISKEYGPDEQGGIQGALTSLQSLTGIVGPILGASAFGYFTSQSAPLLLPGASFWLGAFLIFLSGLLAIRALRAMRGDVPALSLAAGEYSVCSSGE
ncbi:MAG TPA: TCR/Tet family MFS transporter [Chthonomonadaceae bacterium]|nr:TCR/Tet family MFS transporter [Chthonomonadaceae bacterium]